MDRLPPPQAPGSSASGQLSRPQRRGLPPQNQAPTSCEVTLAWEDRTSRPISRAQETDCLPQGRVPDLPTPTWLGGPAAPASHEAPAKSRSCLAWYRRDRAQRIQTPGPPQWSPPPGWPLWTQDSGPPVDILLKVNFLCDGNLIVTSLKQSVIYRMISI